MKSKFGFLTIATVIITTLDQLTKALVRSHFHLWEQKIIIPGVFDLTYAHNTGAAFSFLAQASQNVRVPFFFIVPLAAMVVVLALLKTTRSQDRLQIVALSLIFAGALGNYIDRLRFRYVIDFLDFHWKEVYHYPSFNVADSSICIGVGLLILQQILLSRKTEDASTSKAVS